MVQGREGRPALLSHRAFGQLAQRVSAPPAYLRALPGEKAADLLNYGLATSDPQSLALLFYTNGAQVTRAVTTTRYSRIWNDDVIKRLMDLGEHWQTPPSMTDGQMSSGLYLGDRDMFAFLVNDGARFDDGSDEGLGRGFFAVNSEVGECAFTLITFLYRYICGNHIVWGAQDVTKLWVRHTGRAHSKAFNGFTAKVSEYANSSAAFDEARIKTAREFEIGKTAQNVLDVLFGKRILSKRAAQEAIATATEFETVDGNPRSAWGLAQAVTRNSQRAGFANERYDLDRQAGKILELAF